MSVEIYECRRNRDAVAKDQCNSKAFGENETHVYIYIYYTCTTRFQQRPYNISSISGTTELRGREFDSHRRP